MHYLTRCRLLLALLCLSGPVLAENAPENDPFEPVNRAVFRFNNVLDDAVLKPVSKFYTFVAPDPVERGVRNFFANVGEIRNATNNLFQAKWRDTLTSSGRFAINSTVGVAGLFDVAGYIGLRAKREDFGQTLGYWGITSGPYLVLPLLGPSSVRDSTGKLTDLWLSPLRYTELTYAQRTGLVVLDGLQTRADLLGTENLFTGDSYLIIREAFMSKQAYDSANGGEMSDQFLDSQTGGEAEDEFLDESF